MAYRWDRKSEYGTVAATDYAGLLTYQDVRVKTVSAENGGSFPGKVIVSKVHALPGQYFMIDTNAAPGTSPNLDYWEVGFQFACMRAITGGTLTLFW